MQTIRQDLNSIGIKLDISNATKTMNRLLELTHDRKTWRSSVTRVVQYQLHVTSQQQYIFFHKTLLNFRYFLNSFYTDQLPVKIDVSNSYPKASLYNGLVGSQSQRELVLQKNLRGATYCLSCKVLGLRYVKQSNIAKPTLQFTGYSRK